MVPFNFGEAGPEEHYTTGPRPYDAATADPGWGSWETTRDLWRSASGQFFPWFVCASVAPRAFLYAFEIGWPKTVEEEPAWARYKRVFELNGARDRLDEVHGFGPFPGPGECTNVGVYLRKAIYPVLKRWLDIPVPADEYRNVRPEAELAALTPALAAERQPQPAAAVALAMVRERMRRPASAAQLRTALAARLGDIEPAGAARARVAWSRQESGFAVDGLVLETEPGIHVPALLLKPARPRAAAPAVLAFAQQGKQGFLSARLPDLRALVDQGVLVCLADLRGAGETGSGNRGPGGMGTAGTELMLGNTLIGARLKDARAVFRYLAARPDIDPARIALWGDSFAPVEPPAHRSLRELRPRTRRTRSLPGRAHGSAGRPSSPRYMRTARAPWPPAAASSHSPPCWKTASATSRWTRSCPASSKSATCPTSPRPSPPRPVLRQSQVDGRDRACPKPRRPRLDRNVAGAATAVARPDRANPVKLYSMHRISRREALAGGFAIAAPAHRPRGPGEFGDLRRASSARAGGGASTSACSRRKTGARDRRALRYRERARSTRPRPPSPAPTRRASTRTTASFWPTRPSTRCSSPPRSSCTRSTSKPR